ncbi:MAG: bacillithiol system redox-active protein YtxJ, partial [bacterium]|nr:bacillithiol system redox-active protein YtxJ [bacterium]
IIFKHSYKCPISIRAKKEIDAFLEENDKELEYEFVDVIDNRDRSNEIAEKYGIQHESPQVLVLDKHENVLWDAAHREIALDRLKEAIE